MCPANCNSDLFSLFEMVTGWKVFTAVLCAYLTLASGEEGPGDAVPMPEPIPRPPGPQGPCCPPGRSTPIR